MQSITLLLFLLSILSGCSDYGYHPGYIISQEKPVPEKVEEAPLEGVR